MIYAQKILHTFKNNEIIFITQNNEEIHVRDACSVQKCVPPSHSEALSMKQDRYSCTRKTDTEKVKYDKPCDVPS